MARINRNTTFHDVILEGVGRTLAGGDIDGYLDDLRTFLNKPGDKPSEHLWLGMMAVEPEDTDLTIGHIGEQIPRAAVDDFVETMLRANIVAVAKKVTEVVAHTNSGLDPNTVSRTLVLGVTFASGYDDVLAVIAQESKVQRRKNP